MNVPTITYAIVKMIHCYETETSNKPKQIMVGRNEFDCLLSELKEHVVCVVPNDPYCGVVINGVRIGWGEPE